jgi:nitrate reductase gamma subunit
MASDVAEKVQLTGFAIAYAVLFYFAFLMFFGGLAVRVWRWWRLRPALIAAKTSSNKFETAVQVGAEVVMLRTTFFKDMWAWIFGVCVHFGFLLVVLRHLRYALDPSWTGPLWLIVEISQKLGVYGGLLYIAGVAGFWWRRILVKELRQKSNSSDFLILLLMMAIPIVGYANAYVHTDAIAVKEFFVGLATFKWKPLPPDPLLLIHLWLVAVFLVALPFTKLLHLPEVFEPSEQKIYIGKRLRLVMVAVIGVALLVPGGMATQSIVKSGWTQERPDFSKLTRVHKKLDQTVMVRNHPNFLMHTRSAVVLKGTRVANDTIEQCVTCHAVKDADGKAVGYDSPDHFCRGCHYKAAVSIDCFDCHNSKPTPAEKTAEAFPLHATQTAEAANQRSKSQ